MTTGKQPALFETESPQKQGPVECLGMTFENDDARRAHFTEKLREKLQDPAFRQIDGFPIGEDEDILALSDPPYYTACPNPFIEDFIKHYGKPFDPNEPYHREPFAADVKEGRHEPVYLAHTYHAKVPYRAVMRYIIKYTEPGDVVCDHFAGTGMAGVACQMASNPPRDLRMKLLSEIPNAQFGERIPIISDLAPIAGLIASNYNLPISASKFEQEAERILSEAYEEIGDLYVTKDDYGQDGEVKYFVWSDVFRCPNCGTELSYGDAAYDFAQKRFRDDFVCTGCNADLTKTSIDRVQETVFDPLVGGTIRRVKQSLFLTSFVNKNGKRIHRPSNNYDNQLVKRIDNLELPYELPSQQIPYMHMTHERNNLPALGVTHIHHFFTRRNLIAIGVIFRLINSRPQPIKRALTFWLTSCLPKLSRLMNYNSDGIGRVTKGIFYFSSLSQEASPFHLLGRSIKDIKKCFDELSNISGKSIVAVGSASQVMIPSESIDYVFTDPPFGENIYYADLNYLWESWLGVYTNRTDEAIVSKTDSKDLIFYTNAMAKAFSEYYRILKPGRWITVEFHNSKNAVWMAIQEAMGRAGFVIADVRTLDKKLGTFKQITVASTVRQDLVISAYRPNGGLEERFKLEAGSEDGVWDFVRTHLRQLPVFVQSVDGRSEIIAERMNHLLFDRMVAFHVQRGITVPLSAAEFYAGLEQRFPKRDEMYFLPDQVAEYDQKRMTVKEVLQLQFFVTDESSAIQWLKQQLTKKPQTFQELQPQFMREVKAWEKYEKSLELTEMLEQNYLAYEGQGPIPEQIWSWLQKSSTTREEMEGQTRETADGALRNKAKDRWYVPDPTKAGDLEKLREKALLKEFEEYRESKQKRLKVFRLEAVRAGFKKAWQEQQYRTIIEVAEKIPDNVLQEDPKLLMWYDQAVTRLEM
jgi:16S rRNA G966 N2-methylase RsmD